LSELIKNIYLKRRLEDKYKFRYIDHQLINYNKRRTKIKTFDK